MRSQEYLWKLQTWLAPRPVSCQGPSIPMALPQLLCWLRNRAGPRHMLLGLSNMIQHDATWWYGMYIYIHVYCYITSTQDIHIFRGEAINHTNTRYSDAIQGSCHVLPISPKEIRNQGMVVTKTVTPRFSASGRIKHPGSQRSQWQHSQAAMVSPKVRWR